MAMPMELRLLGRLEIRRNGVPVSDIEANKTLALLSYLAVTTHAHARPALAGLLWGGMSEAKARGNLSKALSTLRPCVGDHLIITRQTVGFAADADFWLDVADFKAKVNQSTTESLRAAVQLYEGDFLAGFYVRHAPEFENWALAQQARLKELVLQALHSLIAHFAGQGPVGQASAIDYTNRLLRLEPWREEAHRQLMSLLALAGQRGAALAQYETCRQALAEELDVEPATETTALYEQIRHGKLRHAVWQYELPLHSRHDPVRTSPPQHNLPAGLTPFLGRESELARLDRLLAEQDVRLISIVEYGWNRQNSARAGSGSSTSGTLCGRRLLCAVGSG